MERFTTVARPFESRFTEKKSEFIGAVIPCETQEEADAFVAERRALHPDARHHVWAFINPAGNVQRFDDDGEPKGTGGIPMLEVLKKAGLTGVCAVVTRYFGGILLGAGGLARAYARGVRDAVDGAGAASFCRYCRWRAEMTYAQAEKAERDLIKRRFSIAGKEYADSVALTVQGKKDREGELFACLSDLTGGKAAPVLT
ncbi:MAG: YigZ family protein, partial [Clostridia bacterium]|nr:YigZ family protein [Clostridia bacterium]